MKKKLVALVAGTALTLFAAVAATTQPKRQRTGNTANRR